MAAVGMAKEADAARCRRHPSHRHAAGVCPFCVSDRLSRLSAAAAKAANDASSSSASSPRSSSEESVASAPPPCREARRARLGMLMRQEEADSAAADDRHGGQEKAPALAPVPDEEKKPAKRSNFWARLQQGRSWYRRDGCSLAHSKAAGDKAAKRAPLF
ncbi:hypothetical protein ACQ4PT_008769 [Festuca glaucescens]